MPSPLAHGSLVLVVRAAAERHDSLRRALAGGAVFFYVATIFTLWAPDIDFLLRALFHGRAVAHGAATHSFAIGVVFGVAFAVVCRIRYGAVFPLAFGCVIGVGCAWAHVLMDMATVGNGVMLLWPFSMERFKTVPLFFGARHTHPEAWDLHLITLTTELMFVIPVWWVTRRWSRREGASGDSAAPASTKNATTRA
jgi:LexA-binding, inner membrane-associated putative hydrolase